MSINKFHCNNRKNCSFHNISFVIFLSKKMNKVSLLTAGRKLNGDLYLLSIYDLEPSGVMVQAYDQIKSKEFLLPISESEVHKLL